jgi:hypothetical protein
MIAVELPVIMVVENNSESCGARGGGGRGE